MSADSAYGSEGSATGPERSVAVVLMARRPRPGRTKTRLIPALGEDGAAAFAAASLGDLAERYAALPLGARFVSWTGEAGEGVLPVSLGPSWQEREQGEGDLGERMARLARAIGGPTVFLGTDAPTVPGHAVLRAARRVAGGEPAVFQPALDGGYTIAAFAGDPAPWFEGVPWGTERVLQETLARAATEGRSVGLMEPWYDVDDAEGLAVLQAHLPALRGADGWPERVARILETASS